MSYINDWRVSRIPWMQEKSQIQDRNKYVYRQDDFMQIQKVVLRLHTSRPTKIELWRSRAVGTRTPGTMLGTLSQPSSRRSERIPSGGRAVGGEGGGIFSLQEHRGRQWAK